MRSEATNRSDNESFAPRLAPQYTNTFPILQVHGYVMVFSITSRQSFEKIRMINESLLNLLGSPSDCPRILCGSMCDLSSQRQVSRDEAEELAEEWGVQYVEFSSKTGENTREVFHLLLGEIEKEGDLLGDKDESIGGCVIL